MLVGPAGLGTWQRREVQLALDRQAELERQGRSFPVIPVLLPKVSDPPGGFLQLQTWVDLRADPNDPGQLDLLLKGIRGQPAAGAACARRSAPIAACSPSARRMPACSSAARTRSRELVAKVRARAAPDPGRPLRQRQVLGGPWPA